MMTENIQILSLGQQLKIAREALGISLSEVSQKTNLKKSHLESLENDIFLLPNIPSAFIRGYVRSYLRFLRLPVELADSIDYEDIQKAKNPKNGILHSTPIKHNDRTQIRWLKMLTWLILLGAIGMTLAWWWQEHKKDQERSHQLVGNILEKLPENSELEIANSDMTVNMPTDTPPVVQESQVLVSSTHSQSVVEKSVIQQDANTNVLLQVKTESSLAFPPEKPKIPLKDELYIEITSANSWISVRNKTNKKLAEKLYNAGEVLIFNDNEQYRLTIGAPANVKIYYKGEQIPLKIDGRVARFKLPLAN